MIVLLILKNNNIKTLFLGNIYQKNKYTTQYFWKNKSFINRLFRDAFDY